METSGWHHELRKAWRQYCDEVGEVDRDPQQFANAALKIAESNPKGAAAVFPSGRAALQGITTPPGDKQVLDFYAKIVDAQTCPLGMLTKRAAGEHVGGRAVDFVLLAGAYVYFLQRRMQAFFLRLRAQVPRWKRVRASFFENISRMFDASTWSYIGHARVVCGREAVSWTHVFFWILRVEYTCLPRPFCARRQSQYSDPDVREAHFNTKAYNHQCGNWQTLQGILVCLRARGGECGTLLKNLVELPVSRAVDEAQKLQRLLLGGEIEGMGHFNTKELLWHCVLFREAYDHIHGRSGSSLIAFRQRLFATTLFGSGGLQGLRIFYPRVTQQTAHECAEELRQYLECTHGVTFMEAHDNQWGLCTYNFQLTTSMRCHRGSVEPKQHLC